MKPKHFILLVLAVAMVAIGLWWFTRTPEDAPEKTAEAPIEAKSGSATIAGLQTIAPSATLSASKPDVVPVTAAEPNAAPPADPIDSQAELKTAIPDLARMLRLGDRVAFARAYYSPDQLTPLTINRLQEEQQHEQVMIAQHPEDQQAVQGDFEFAAKLYEALEDETPDVNATGDEATYNWPSSFRLGPKTPPSIIFVKINGKWYLKDGPVGPG